MSTGIPAQQVISSLHLNFSLPSPATSYSLLSLFLTLFVGGSDSIDREIRVHGKCDHPNIVKVRRRRGVGRQKEVRAVVRRDERGTVEMNFDSTCQLYGYYELGATVALILGFVEGSELHDVLQVCCKCWASPRLLL